MCKHSTFFDTITVNTGNATEFILAAARAEKFNLRQVDDNTIGISLDEIATRDNVKQLFDVFTHDQGSAITFHETGRQGGQ